MALITCPECGNEISEYAEKCPFCGYPRNLMHSDIPPAPGGEEPPKYVSPDADSTEEKSKEKEQAKGYRSEKVPADVEMLDTDANGRLIIDSADQNLYPIKTNLTESILTTIFCCIPFGIVAIVYSAIASEHLKNLRYADAEHAGMQAHFWNQVGWFSGIVGGILWFLIRHM